MTDLGKRQMERFDLSIPAVITLENHDSPDDRKAQRELKTKNVCGGGAFFVTDDPLAIDTQVDVDLHLAFYAGNVTRERHSNIHVSGSVVRIEPGGMAIQFDDKYQIFPLHRDS